MNLYDASLMPADYAEEAPMELTHEQVMEGRAHFQSIIDRGDAARRLADNDDFKLLVMQGYLSDEGHRLQELLTSGRLTNQMTIDGIMRDLVAIGSFRNYLKNFTEQAQIARSELEALNEAYEESLKEAE